MAEVKISQLPFIGSSSLTDFSTSVQAGTTWQATNQQVLSLVPTVPGIVFPLSQGGLGANITAINNGVFSTNGSGISQLSTTLPAGLTIPGYATTAGLGAYLPLAGGALTGSVTTTSTLQFKTLQYTTGTISQSGFNLTGSGTAFTSAMNGGWLVPSSGSAQIILNVNSGTSAIMSWPRPTKPCPC